ncbi:MAG TPA: hypothetical protein VMS43_01965 [Allosphingosinicella sp.]|nr:hypothetical protein [Allosphingosinicella sp.]
MHDDPPSWLLSAAIQALVIGAVQAESPIAGLLAESRLDRQSRKGNGAEARAAAE